MVVEKEFVCTIEENEEITLRNYNFSGVCIVKVNKDSGSGELIIGDYTETNSVRVVWSDGNDMYEIARTLLAGLLRIGEVKEDMTVKEIVGEYNVEENPIKGRKIKGFGYYREV